MVLVGWRKSRSRVEADSPTVRLHLLVPLGATSHWRYRIEGTASDCGIAINCMRMWEPPVARKSKCTFGS